MPTPSWIEKLKQKWNLGSAWQVVIVLVVFACTGFTVLFIKKPLLRFLAGAEGDTVLASVLYYLLILPVYNVLLLAYGFLFGQFSFFWEFEKRFFKRVFSGAKNTKK
jgi:Na+-driven multidrug efflux pump